MPAHLVVGAADLVLAAMTFLGRTWARLLLMLGSAAFIVEAFFADVRALGPPTLSTDLPAVTTSILVLLALTSHRAREFASRGAQVGARSGGLPSRPM